uniref:DNA-directed RNA polymerase subunit n=1 Tax=Floydiella terrestris TaxID=51328 RepID=E2DSN8_FLOTE|nr:beta' subunit of RNA polymerase [Floydiella terrestris]ACZ58492.1 beta' subunit of RNA polymerase [Floydiella terrestris]
MNACIFILFSKIQNAFLLDTILYGNFCFIHSKQRNSIMKNFYLKRTIKAYYSFLKGNPFQNKTGGENSFFTLSWSSFAKSQGSSIQTNAKKKKSSETPSVNFTEDNKEKNVPAIDSNSLEKKEIEEIKDSLPKDSLPKDSKKENSKKKKIKEKNQIEEIKDSLPKKSKKEKSLPKKSKKKDSLPKESKKKQVIPKESKKEEEIKESLPKKSKKEKSLPKNSKKKDSLPKKSTKEVIPKESKKEEEKKKKGKEEIKESLPKDSKKEKSLPKESKKKQVIPKKSTKEKPILKKSKKKEGILKESKKEEEKKKKKTKEKIKESPPKDLKTEENKKDSLPKKLKKEKNKKEKEDSKKEEIKESLPKDLKTKENKKEKKEKKDSSAKNSKKKDSFPKDFKKEENKKKVQEINESPPKKSKKEKSLPKDSKKKQGIPKESKKEEEKKKKEKTKESLPKNAKKEKSLPKNSKKKQVIPKDFNKENSKKKKTKEKIKESPPKKSKKTKKEKEIEDFSVVDSNSFFGKEEKRKKQPKKKSKSHENTKKILSVSKDQNHSSLLSTSFKEKNSEGKIHPIPFKKRFSDLKAFDLFKEKIHKKPRALIEEKRLVTISMASPELIRQWAEKTLPNGKVFGQVLNANTLHYSTLKPIKGGLFCERIFGPINDFECACGIKIEKPIRSFSTSLEIEKEEKKSLKEREFCPECDVEYTWSDKRRHQLGYIQLAIPVTHIWYLKFRPSTISILLGSKKQEIESIAYCEKSFTLDMAWKPSRFLDFFYYSKMLKREKSKSFLPPVKKGEKIRKENAIKPIRERWWRLSDQFDEQGRRRFLDMRVRRAMMTWEAKLSKQKQKQKPKQKLNIFQKPKQKPKQKLSTFQKPKQKLRTFQKPKQKLRTFFQIFKFFRSFKNFRTTTLGLKQELSLDEETKENQKEDLEDFFLQENLETKNPVLLNSLSCFSHRKAWEPGQIETFVDSFWPKEEPRDLPMPFYKTRALKKTLFSNVSSIVGSGLLAPLLTECNKKEFFKILLVFKKRVKNIINTIFVVRKRIKILKRLDLFFGKVKKKLRKSKKKLENLRQKLEIAINRIETFKKVYLPTNYDKLEKIEKHSLIFQNDTFFTYQKKKREILKEMKKQKKYNKKLFLDFQYISNSLRKKKEKRILKETNEPGSFLFPFSAGKTLFEYYSRKKKEKMSTESFFISYLPVLPPGLRPILQIDDQIISTDLNRLYQKVVYQNERVLKFMQNSALNNPFSLSLAQKLLQEAVDNLLENGKGGTKPETDNRGRPLKSLSDLLKGKQGRFRQNLLGKRVDYSGRSVIVVGPKLKLHQCGLPKEMALELFMPFLIKELLASGRARTFLGAKKIIRTDDVLTFHHLKKVVNNHVILLNRAPTLHKVGFQAFRPILVDGRAILIHPLVCPGFNADFDGDQMAVHVPITPQARAEAFKFMLSQNNLLSTATGEPALLPSQDMVLGIYYLTTSVAKSIPEQKKKTKLFFSSFDEVLKAYDRNLVSIHTNIWVRFDGLIQTDPSANGKKEAKILELRIHSTGQNRTINSDSSARLFDSNQNRLSQVLCTTPGRVLFHFILQKTRT